MTHLGVSPAAPGDAHHACLVPCPPGGFEQGSPDDSELAVAAEKPQRAVTLDDAFAIGIYEVTLEEWDACVTAGGCSQRPPDNGWGRGRRPAIMVSWNDAQEYVSWLSRADGVVESRARFAHVLAVVDDRISYGDVVGHGFGIATICIAYGE